MRYELAAVYAPRWGGGDTTDISVDSLCIHSLLYSDWAQVFYGPSALASPRLIELDHYYAPYSGCALYDSEHCGIPVAGGTHTT